MGLDIEVVGFCADYLGVFYVPGSKKGDLWRVELSGPEGGAHCDCPAFKFSKGEVYDKTCKHIEYVWKNACLYNPQWHDGGPRKIKPNSYVDESRFLSDPCPCCGGPMFPVRIAV